MLLRTILFALDVTSEGTIDGKPLRSIRGLVGSHSPAALPAPLRLVVFIEIEGRVEDRGLPLDLKLRLRHPDGRINERGGGAIMLMPAAETAPPELSLSIPITFLVTAVGPIDFEVEVNGEVIGHRLLPVLDQQQD